MKPSDPSSDPTLPISDDTERGDPATAPTGKHVLPASIASYDLGEVIGRGGMGEVLLARDRQIGRDVAIKRMRDVSSGDARDRFLREARIQARLDHPAIVPVYELGTDNDGQPYFTMKRLAGVTLADMLASAAPPRQRMLRAFADVCRAVEFAHARAIVHRDLKPANIMLGDYGEVYVLDWGLARVLDADTDSAVERGWAAPVASTGGTEAGALLGTPGYMAPEQIHDAADIGRPTDVYALGAILFEILANEPLHPRGEGAIASTLSEIDVSPARRRPDRGVPPELDALCVAALAAAPAKRPPIAELSQRVQSYLDGDRDVERRRALAAAQLAQARAAFGNGQRTESMRAAGRALALDPESEGAAELVGALLLEPPAVPPPDLRAALQEADDTAIRKHARGALPSFLAIVLLVPLAIWNGVTSWRYTVGLVALTLVLGAVGAMFSRSAGRPREMVFYMLGVAALIAMLGRLCSPFLFVPGVAAFVATSAATYPAFNHRSWLILLLVGGGWAVPLLAESFDLLRSTWHVHDGAFVFTSYAIRLDGTPTIVFAVFCTIATLVVASTHGARIGRTHQAARHQLVAQAWHLRQLLPVPTRGRAG